MELVTGATGYVGGRLVKRLLADRRPVRALARRPEALASGPEGLASRTGMEVARGDVLTGEGVRAALEGCSVAYYLVHSMEAAAAGAPDFAARDRRAAEGFAAAASAAGVERVVYLGGLAPGGSEPPSPHIASRLQVERILLDRAPGTTALRASIVIGARSPSFRVLVRLVERLRVLPLPAWRRHRTQPIAEHNAIEMLARAPLVAAAAERSLDIAGPDLVSYEEMIERIAEQMGVGRARLGLGASLTPPVSAFVSAIARQPPELVRPLMESLEHDLLPRDADEAPRLLGVEPLPLDRAIERALAEWEAHEELSAR